MTITVIIFIYYTLCHCRHNYHPGYSPCRYLYFIHIISFCIHPFSIQFKLVPLQNETSRIMFDQKPSDFRSSAVLYLPIEREMPLIPSCFAPFRLPQPLGRFSWYFYECDVLKVKLLVKNQPCPELHPCFAKPPFASIHITWVETHGLDLDPTNANQKGISQQHLRTKETNVMNKLWTLGTSQSCFLCLAFVSLSDFPDSNQQGDTKKIKVPVMLRITWEKGTLIILTLRHVNKAAVFCGHTHTHTHAMSLWRINHVNSFQ